MAKVRKNSKAKRRLLVFMPICLLAISFIFIYIGSYWVQIAEKYQEKQELENRIIVLKEQEEILKVDVDRLKDPDYVARYAREKFMYSKDGEIILRLPDVTE